MFLPSSVIVSHDAREFGMASLGVVSLQNSNSKERKKKKSECTRHFSKAADLAFHIFQVASGRCKCMIYEIQEN